MQSHLSLIRSEGPKATHIPLCGARFINAKAGGTPPLPVSVTTIPQKIYKRTSQKSLPVKK
jgi:hypothetical protein